MLEGPGRVQRSASGSGDSARVFNNLVVGAREVAGRVVVGLVLVDVNIDDGAIELGVPGAVGCAIDVEAGAVAGVGPG